MLSGYRLMWMLVMFDLPVVEAAERAAATRFKLSLLDMGFSRAQLSVYMRFCTSHAQVQTYCKQVEAALPKGGQVNVLQLTDKQYERIISFQGRRKEPAKKHPISSICLGRTAILTRIKPKKTHLKQRVISDLSLDDWEMRSDRNISIQAF